MKKNLVYPRQDLLLGKQPMAQHRVIYDLGANNGDNIPYYLKSADVVVAVEANPMLCEDIKRKYMNFIDAGQLFVKNGVVTDNNIGGEDVSFYIHNKNNVLSQYLSPKNKNEYTEIRIPSLYIIDLLNKYGDPYYIKIDIEGYDECILKELFSNNIYPNYISSECQSTIVFALMVDSGGYNSFKLVDGLSVEKTYKNFKFGVAGNRNVYSFPFHSAGPFGEDIYGDWMSANQFIRVLGSKGLGWKDIHATNVSIPNKSINTKNINIIMDMLRDMFIYISIKLSRKFKK